MYLGVTHLGIVTFQGNKRTHLFKWYVLTSIVKQLTSRTMCVLGQMFQVPYMYSYVTTYTNMFPYRLDNNLVFK